MNSKVLILNNDQEKNFKAILNLKSGENCAIKFFNLKEKYKNLALGIKQNEEIYKIPLVIKGDEGSFVCDGLNLQDNFTCAVVNVSNAFSPEIVLSASGEDSFEIEKIESSFVSSQKEDDKSKLYSEDSDEEIEDLIDKNLEEDLSSTYYDCCAKCKYREAFYGEGESVCAKCEEKDNEKIAEEEGSSFGVAENQVSFLDDVPYIEDINGNINKNDAKGSVESLSSSKKALSGEIEEDGKTFYEQISTQIDALFRKYEKDEVLENIIPNSSWVKVTYDDCGGYYVLGLLYGASGEVAYVAYGMPSNDKNIPPDDLAEFAEWLEVDANKGYWIVYQESNGGKTVKSPSFEQVLPKNEINE